MMPWLLCGGALHLHHGFEVEAFAAQCREVPEGTLVLPAPAVHPIAKMGLIDTKQTIVALWRAPERFKAAKTWNGPLVLIDVASFGEIGFIAARRGDNGLPAPLPLGPVGGVPPALETARTSAGTLALRGRMVPGLRADQPCLLLRMATACRYRVHLPPWASRSNPDHHGTALGHDRRRRLPFSPSSDRRPGLAGRSGRDHSGPT
jgi:hypothetical protein